jgi:DNA-binding response OmpR family regulator
MSETKNAKKIAVVDDDFFMRDALEMMLTDHDYAVQSFPDGKNILDTYQAGQYDAIVMDTEMVNSIGYEVCRELRTQDSNVVIIGISGSRSYRQQWIDAGATCFLHKGDLGELSSVLEEQLTKKNN